MSDPKNQKKSTLLRSMGFWQIWAIGVGAVVGGRYFPVHGQRRCPQQGLPLFSHLVSQVSCRLFIMVAMGELSVGMPEAGAMSVWVEKYMV